MTIRLKLVKGEAENFVIESQDPGGLHGARLMIFLVKPWANSGRLVNDDSCFSSVPCSFALMVMGLRQFFLSEIELPQKDDYKGVL